MNHFPGTPPGDSAVSTRETSTRFSQFLAAEGIVHGRLVRHSISVLRVTMGLVFLAFGALKYIPGASPAQDLAVTTTRMLSRQAPTERASARVVVRGRGEFPREIPGNRRSSATAGPDASATRVRRGSAPDQAPITSRGGEQ